MKDKNAKKWEDCNQGNGAANKIDKQKGQRKLYEADCDGAGLTKNRQVNCLEPEEQSGGASAWG